MTSTFLRRRLIGATYLCKVTSQVLLPIHSTVMRCNYSPERIVDIGQPTCRTHPELLKDGEITPGISVDEYISRRKKLLELLPERSLTIVASAPIKMMTDVVPYSFRQDADYLYLTGCSQPGGIAVIAHDCDLCMFMPDLDPHDEAWQGPAAGVHAALNYFKSDKAYPMSKLQQVLSEMIAKASKVFHNVKTVSRSYTDLESFKRAMNNGKVKDLSYYTNELRWIKSPSELKLMRQSASIACQSLLQTMLFSRMNPEESKLSAKVEFECKMRGAQRMAFNPVVGGGANGSVVHYSRNDKKIGHKDLVLMDMGCEFHGYVSDLTRTWSPYGNITPFQEHLYQLILETNKECIKLCKPGASLQEINSHSVKLLKCGFKQIGILPDETSYAYNQLNPTAIGHYLGMDIHDSTTISSNRALQSGVVITIEPGVYIPMSFNAPERGIGIRVEDEVLITETGHEVLTASMPKEISHINSLLSFDNSWSEVPYLKSAFS